MHRKAWQSRWNLLERRLHSLEISLEQLASLPPDSARHEKPRYRSRRCQDQRWKLDEGQRDVCIWLDKGY